MTDKVEYDVDEPVRDRTGRVRDLIVEAAGWDGGDYFDYYLAKEVVGIVKCSMNDELQWRADPHYKPQDLYSMWKEMYETERVLIRKMHEAEGPSKVVDKAREAAKK